MSPGLGSRDVTGSKRELRPGVWELRVSLGRDAGSGKYKQLSRTYHGDAAGADAALAALVATELPRLREKVSNGHHAHSGEDTVAEGVEPSAQHGAPVAGIGPVAPAAGLRQLIAALPLDAGESVVGWSADRALPAVADGEAEYRNGGAAVYQLVQVHRLRRSGTVARSSDPAPRTVWVRRELVEQAQPMIAQDCAIHIWTL